MRSWAQGEEVHIYSLFKHTKGYAFLGEHVDESVTELESCDANFLEQEFPSKGEVHWVSVLYKMDESALSCPVDQENSEPTPLGNSGSSIPTDDTMPPSHEYQILHRSNRNMIPHCRFKIEGGSVHGSTT